MSLYLQSSRDNPWNTNTFPSYVSQNNYNDIIYPKGNFRDGSTILTTINNDYLFFLVCLIEWKIFFSFCIKELNSVPCRTGTGLVWGNVWQQ